MASGASFSSMGLIAASVVVITGACATVATADAVPTTFCNPLNLPYRFQLDDPVRREAADPTMIVFRGLYWLFASKSGGYWHSPDLVQWTLVEPTGLPLEDYAPTVFVLDDKLHFTAFDTKAVFKTEDPAVGIWDRVATLPAFADPGLFVDDDQRVFAYYGCANFGNITGVELNPENEWREVGPAVDLVSASPHTRGWEVSGDYNDAPGGPWMEGAWMNKLGNKYYLQYAAPGTQFLSYADGVVVSDSPLGPFAYYTDNPFSHKPSGFAAGAGHSSTFQAIETQKLWHVATSSISVRHMFERRLGLYPTHLSAEGHMITDTYLGDYPRKLDGSLAGWMLLSRHCAVNASSSLTNLQADLAVDDNIRTWWSAKRGGTAQEWFQVDLGKLCRINAIQVNFADQDATTKGRLPKGEAYRFKIDASPDAVKYVTVVDETTNVRDAPHDYFELSSPLSSRFVRIANSYTPAGAKFSLFDFRIFGSSNSPPPSLVSNLAVQRDTDRRSAHLTWTGAADADFYIVRYGIAKDWLFHNYQVDEGGDGSASLTINSLFAGSDYYFAVDSVNGGGITKASQVLPG